MLRINDIRLPLDGDEAQLRRKVASILGVSPNRVGQLELMRKSIDARKKSNVHFVCSVRCQVEDEARILRRMSSHPHVTADRETPYQVPPARITPPDPPIIVGMGPCGLFCALALAYAGVPSILLERGRPVEARAKDVASFWQTGLLNPDSNVQFGEGGAGTFSDGKLTTGIGDPRIRWVLEQFVAAGAPSDILYQQKPHVGTDVLQIVVRNLRLKLQEMGCTFLYEHQFIDFTVSHGALSSISVKTSGSTKTWPARVLVLAPGHSARDTFRMLYDNGVSMASKPFAIGVRAEHAQDAINMAQFGPAASKLPPADYKLSCHLPSGRSVFSFCVCPGGAVVAAASQKGHLVTNGMSLRARDGKTINGGILVEVSPGDYGSPHPLSGISFQEQWEKAAFQLGGGRFFAPVQRLGDFLLGVPTRALGAVTPTYQPGVTLTDLAPALPGPVIAALRDAFPLFGRRVSGFDHPDTVLTGVETRSSSPVRILRDASGQSNIQGIFPCGEGAGYAGGIMSAAVDGIRCAERICGNNPH